jgi:hypothetical protein
MSQWVCPECKVLHFSDEARRRLCRECGYDYHAPGAAGEMIRQFSKAVKELCVAIEKLYEPPPGE